MSATTLPTLYKFTKSGAVQQWTVEAFDGWYEVTYGRQNGKMQTSTMMVEKKNVGKSNETTLEEQALLEATSKWKSQLDKGYREGAPVEMANIKPMLAHSKSYESNDKRVSFPCWIQPKLDGVRCIAAKINGKVTLWTRKQKEIPTLPHINKVLEDRLQDGEIVDGELYRHGETFQKLISWIKKNQEESATVQLHIYDVVSPQPYRKRLERIVNITLHGIPSDSVLAGVQTDPCKTSDDIDYYASKHVEHGFEGAILRIGDCEYRNGYRSRELIKVKSFDDGEFRIVGAEQNKGRMIDQCCFVCETTDGNRFKVKPQGTDAERREYWENKEKYIGKLLTVRYFGITTSDNPVPRFPIGIAIRDYE
jgi:DNA ligase-1